ncbi:MAG TPA: hypothetical protein VFS43_20605 [Polyangiaceae bacterium]|nr:hypothetical protein [Polyangiaceae bacterium]
MPPRPPRPPHGAVAHDEAPPPPGAPLRRALAPLVAALRAALSSPALARVLGPPGSPRRAALGLWALATLAYLACAAPARLAAHTPYNHFAHLAWSWLHGRLDLAGAPPDYARGNDFAFYGGRWFVVFPGFPALLAAPFVALAGSPEAFRDGLFFVALAGLAPALLYLGLGRLAAEGLSSLGARARAALALFFGLGTVYWFSAVQGTVWYAAHAVGAALAALYLWAAAGARRPFVAGLALALGFWTRAPLLFALPWFVAEARRLARARGPRAAARASAWFLAPLALTLALAAWHNRARFGDPLEFGYRYLVVAWADRIERWGLFSYHFLPRNLAVVLAGLPVSTPEAPPGAAPLRLGVHGLALWATTPLYLALARPTRGSPASAPLALTALAVALPSLLYQNSGQIQFGYRFSNDYAVFLFAWLATSRRRLGPGLVALGLAGVLVNALGALSFDRPWAARYYLRDGSQALVPDD